MAGLQASLRASQEATKLGDSKAYDALEGDFREVSEQHQASCGRAIVYNDWNALYI
jgi:hypothetical protein